jgi:dTDP-4-dehydrorhamnose reductase
VRLLVVGASGHLGGEIARQAAAAGWDVVGTHWAHPGAGTVPLDIRELSTVVSAVAHVRPDAVVNAAYAYAGWRVSADGAAHVAVAAARVGARLVHVSSDVVHSGRLEPYGDDEPPSPLHPYGAAKAAAETAVRVADPQAVLVRTSLIVGGPTSQQVALCLDLLTGRREGALFADEIRCPVAVEDLAAAVLELARTPYVGLLNVAGPQAVSRVEFGQLVAAHYGLDPAGLKVSTIAESGLVRPDRIVLDSSRSADLLTTAPRPVGEVLAGRRR